MRFLFGLLFGRLWYIQNQSLANKTGRGFNFWNSFSIGNSPAVELKPELHSGYFIQISGSDEFILLNQVGLQEITAKSLFKIQINFNKQIYCGNFHLKFMQLIKHII